MNPNHQLRRDANKAVNQKFIVKKTLRYLYTMWWLREIGKLYPEDGEQWEAALLFENRLRKGLSGKRPATFLRTLLKALKPARMSLAYQASILWTRCADAGELEQRLRELYPPGKFPEKAWEKSKRKYKPQNFSGAPR